MNHSGYPTLGQSIRGLQFPDNLKLKGRAEDHSRSEWAWGKQREGSRADNESHEGRPQRQLVPVCEEIAGRLKAVP